LKNFDEKKIRDKGKLDKKIDEMFETGRGLIILGDIGVGKTMDLVYIFKRICNEQKDYEDIPVSYYFMPTLFKKLHQGEDVSLDKFVMLDDWGREYAEPFALSQFEALIEKLYSREAMLIITTNLTKDQFTSREGWGRITDRVREMCAIFEISGNSMRHR
jgi:DNA replication protein DnaC